MNGQTNLSSGAANANLSAGAAVSNRNAGQRGTSVGAGLLRVNNGLRQSGHIHARVRLARDEELVLGKLREHAEEGLHRGKVLGRGAVIVALVVASLGVTETDTDGGLDVEHVHLAVPILKSDIFLKYKINKYPRVLSHFQSNRTHQRYSLRVRVWKSDETTNGPCS